MVECSCPLRDPLSSSARISDAFRSMVASHVLCEVYLLAETEDLANMLQSDTVRKLRKAFVPTMMTAEQASTLCAQQNPLTHC